jgi:hypothetical protein
VDSITTSTPRSPQPGGVALAEHADLLAVDDQRAIAFGDLAGEAAQDGVVAEQMGKRPRVGDVVDGDEVEVRAGLEGGAEEVSPDSTEAVDPDLHGCHSVPPVIDLHPG